MKDNYLTLSFVFSVILALFGKRDTVTGQEFDSLILMMKKALGSAYVNHDFSFGKGTDMLVTVDTNKLECQVEKEEDLVHLIRKSTAQAKDTIENPSEAIRYSQRNEANKLVKISGKFGDEEDRQKSTEYEKRYEPFETDCTEVSKVSMDYDSAIHPCMTTLSFRYEGQDIKCSIDEDILEEIRDVIDAYQSGDVKTLNISIKGLKNKLGKYKEVKLAGLDQA